MATYTDSIDGLTTSVATKAPVKVATIAAITLYGEQTIDGVACVEGDRVLVKDQASAIENGIYVCSESAWYRALDFNGNRDVVKGTSVRVANDELSSGTLYVVTTDDPIVFGTSSITFEAIGPLAGADINDALVTDNGESLTLENAIGRRAVRFANLEAFRASSFSGPEAIIEAANAGTTTGRMILKATGTTGGTPTVTGSRFSALAGGTFTNEGGYGFDLAPGQMINPWMFGVECDGSIETAGCRYAVQAGERLRQDVYFFWHTNGYRTEKIDVPVGSIRLIGVGWPQMHHCYSAVVEGSGGAGSTKAWPVFMIYRDADNVEITGFDFRTDATLTTALGSISSSWYSYISHIIAHNADNVKIHNNRFNGTTDRCIFFHGGNWAHIHDNWLGAQSMILHVGHAQNQNFWDEGANDSSTWYSPQASIIENNVGSGYAGTINNVIFLSGCVKPTVRNNKILNVDSATCLPIQIYANDLGLTDIDGTPILEMGGAVYENEVTGTYADGIYFNGYSTNATSQVHEMRVAVYGNKVRGTGNGMYFERFNLSDVYDNDVKVTGSPLRLTRDITSSQWYRNKLTCTSAGQAGLTIWAGSNLEFISSSIEDNDITSSTGDTQVLYVVNALNDFQNSAFRNNRVTFNGTTGSPTVITITKASGSCDFDGNKYTIAASAMAGRPLHVITSTGNVSANNNELLSSTVSLNPSEISCVDFRSVGSRGWPGFAVTATGLVIVDDADIEGGASVTARVLTITGATLAIVRGSRILRSAALTNSVIMFSACAKSRLLSNQISGNSSVPLVRVDSSGALQYWGNDQINAGAGGVTYTTSGTASAAAMSGT